MHTIQFNSKWKHTNKNHGVNYFSISLLWTKRSRRFIKLVFLQVGVAAFDLRSASLHLSQYIETSCSYHNTKTLLHFYDPMVAIVPPNKTAADGMVGVSELVGKHLPTNKKVMADICKFVLCFLIIWTHFRLF